MRFKIKDKPAKNQPKANSFRVRSWFAIFPVKIGQEIRWLETVSVRQRYCVKYEVIESFHVAEIYGWVNWEWRRT